MAMMPKRVKFRKAQRGRRAGTAHKGSQINFGDCALKAIENGSPAEGIASIEYGGVRYSKAVDLSPQRRVDLALRWITQGAYHSATSSKGKKKITQTLSEEIMAAANNDINASNAAKKKTELERQAQASR